MEEVFSSIITKFEIINKKGYIKGITNNLYNGAGLTFEFLIGKEADSLFFPNYYGVEIKTTQRFSRHPITLFSLAFDGPDFYEANYLLHTYGKNDNEVFNKKILIINLQFNNPKKYGNYYFDLGVDYEKMYIYINVYDDNMKLIEKRGYINLSKIKERLEVKLRYLSVIYASKKIKEDNLYFQYYKIECYTLKNFDDFIKALVNNKLSITLMLRISRSKEELGRQQNKNLVFAISKNKINSIFNKIYEFER